MNAILTFPKSLQGLMISGYDKKKKRGEEMRFLTSLVDKELCELLWDTDYDFLSIYHSHSLCEPSRLDILMSSFYKEDRVKPILKGKKDECKDWVGTTEDQSEILSSIMSELKVTTYEGFEEAVHKHKFIAILAMCVGSKFKETLTSRADQEILEKLIQYSKESLEIGR